MNEVLPVLLERMSGGESLVLVTILESHGSTPRGPGACMLVNAGGRIAGTIGGGMMERTAELDAMALAGGQSARVCGYKLNNSEAGSLGMVCGGEALVLLQPMCKEHLPLLQELYQRRLQGGAELIRAVGEDGRVTMNLDSSRPKAGEQPTLVKDSGGGLLFREPVQPSARALIFGGGHVARALVPQLDWIGFDCIVYDDRPEFANMELFPLAKRVLSAPFQELSAHLEIGAGDFVLVMTRGHAADYAVLAQTVRTPARYVGCIGSRSKRAHLRERLLQDGFTEEDFRRVYTPIGLSIGAQTPEEISVSIAAELIMVRAGLNREEWTWK